MGAQLGYHDVHFICGKAIVQIDMYIEQCVSLVFLFFGEVGKFCPSWSSCVSGLACRNLSPTWENYLVRVKFGIRNVCRMHLTDI